jgi:hypothetical protein
MQGSKKTLKGMITMLNKESATNKNAQFCILKY